jgi:CheY-like chemotaxis protein
MKCLLAVFTSRPGRSARRTGLRHPRTGFMLALATVLSSTARAQFPSGVWEATSEHGSVVQFDFSLDPARTCSVSELRIIKSNPDDWVPKDNPPSPATIPLIARFNGGSVAAWTAFYRDQSSPPKRACRQVSPTIFQVIDYHIVPPPGRSSGDEKEVINTFEFGSSSPSETSVTKYWDGSATKPTTARLRLVSGALAPGAGCSSFENCLEASGYGATMGLAAGLLGLLAGLYGIRSAGGVMASGVAESYANDWGTGAGLAGTSAGLAQEFVDNWDPNSQPPLDIPIDSTFEDEVRRALSDLLQAPGNTVSALNTGIGNAAERVASVVPGAVSDLLQAPVRAVSALNDKMLTDPASVALATGGLAVGLLAAINPESLALGIADPTWPGLSLPDAVLTDINFSVADPGMDAIAEAAGTTARTPIQLAYEGVKGLISFAQLPSSGNEGLGGQPVPSVPDNPVPDMPGVSQDFIQAETNADPSSNVQTPIQADSSPPYNPDNSAPTDYNVATSDSPPVGDLGSYEGGGGDGGGGDGG